MKAIKQFSQLLTLGICLGSAFSLLVGCANSGTDPSIEISDLESNLESGAAIARTKPESSSSKSDLPPWPQSPNVPSSVHRSPAVQSNLLPPAQPFNPQRQTRLGRRDPFAAIAIKSPKTAPQQPIAATNSGLPPIPIGSPNHGLPPVPHSGLPPVPVAATPVPILPTPVQQPAIPVPASTPPNVPAAPTSNVRIPPANLISAIRISGIVHAGAEVNAIVAVPNQSISRYVSVGDYIGDGKILVKRIEVSSSQQPKVVLEQDGHEYVKTVQGSSTTGIL
ncbi:MAG: hypothetical protein F6K19_13350 [Cyanothece sp. SIO1E1]|nr:hypothetical protein [Cyanothece sp. SIO1E1]